MRGGTVRVAADCGEVLAVIVLPSLPLILCNCWQLISSPAPASGEDRTRTQGSHPGSLHYLWPVVKHTPLLLLPTSSLPPHSQTNYQHYHLLFKRDAAQMKRMRSGEPVRVEKMWLRMRKGVNKRNSHRLEQSNSVKEGANEKESRAQWRLCEAADNHCFMSLFCATHQFLLSWLEMTLLEVGTPTSHKNEFITAFYLPHQRPQRSAGKAFQQPSRAAHSRALGGGHLPDIYIFTEGKAQSNLPLSTAAFKRKHVRNTSVIVGSSVNECCVLVSFRSRDSAVFLPRTKIIKHNGVLSFAPALDAQPTPWSYSCCVFTNK